MTRVTLTELAQIPLTDDWDGVRFYVHVAVWRAVHGAVWDAVCGVVWDIVWYALWAVVWVVVLAVVSGAVWRAVKEIL
jgi:ABC-type anion transport system duplicated permease subunit